MKISIKESKEKTKKIEQIKETIFDKLFKNVESRPGKNKDAYSGTKKPLKSKNNLGEENFKGFDLFRSDIKKYDDQPITKSENSIKEPIILKKEKDNIKIENIPESVMDNGEREILFGKISKKPICDIRNYYISKLCIKFNSQNVIKDHKLFSNNEFWEKTLDNSLKNEINRVKNIKKENEFKNEINIEDENIEKYNDIAFGQIVSLVNSMIDFDINIEIIKKIIEPKIEEYKLNENHRQNINLVMQNKTNTDNNDINIKINTDKNENNKEEDTENKENINIIKNDDEDNKLVDENNINNIDIKSDEK
jgi:hypothetical protein